MAARAAPRSLWTRLGLTLLAPVAMIGGRYVPLPGFDAGALEGLVAQAGDVFKSTTGSGVNSLVGIGLGPVLAAYLVVELAAVLVPGWRPLRHGGLEGRARLERATAIVALLLATFQAYSLSMFASAAGFLHPTGLVTTVVLILSLVAGVALLMLLARAIGRYGLCNGYAALAVAAWLGDDLLSFYQRVFLDREPVTATGLAAALVGFAIIAGATLIALGVRWDRRLHRAGGAAPSTEVADPEAGLGYRQRPPAGVSDGSGLPLPASGIAPLHIAVALAALPSALMRLGLPGYAEVAAFVDATNSVPVHLALTAAAAFVLARLFNAPARVAALRAQVAVVARTGAASPEGGARDDLRDALVQTLAFLGVLTAVLLGAPAYAPYFPGVFAVVLATALGVDIASEWRARRRMGHLVLIWPEHRPYAVGPVTAALAAADIPVLARGRHLRAMLQGFGPWVPIELLVRPEQAEEALAIVSRALHSRPPEEAPTQLPGAPPSGAKRRRAGTKARKVRAGEA